MEATVAEGIKIMTLTFHDGTKMAGSVRPIAANCIAIFQFCEPIGIVSITIFELRKWKRTDGRPFFSIFETKMEVCYFPFRILIGDVLTWKIAESKIVVK